MKFARKVMNVLEAKAVGTEGIVEAYVSVFNNVDYAGEVIRPGFFTDTINEAKLSGQFPIILWSHNSFQQPLGVTTDAVEVLPYESRLPKELEQLGGLLVTGRFNLDVQAAKEAYSNIAFGALRKYSIGYFVIEDKFNRETGIVELLKGDWVEWSPVNFAANDMTLTAGVKGAAESHHLGNSTEHLYIVRPPSDFVTGSFKRQQHTEGDRTYSIVTGKLRATGNTEEANVRFDSDVWSTIDAKSLCSGRGRGTFTVAADAKDEGTNTRERLADHGARVCAQVSAFLDRVDEIKELRLREGKAGRVLSEANRNILKGLLPDLASVSERVQKLLDDTEITSDSGKSEEVQQQQQQTSEDGRKLFGRILAMQAQISEEIAS